MSTSGLFDELQGHDPDAEAEILGGQADTPTLEEEDSDKKPAKKTSASSST